MVRAAADEHGQGWVLIPPAVLPPEGMIPKEERARFMARMWHQPVATFTEPVRLTGGIDRLSRAFIRCTGGVLNVGGDPIGPVAARAQSEGWPYRELAAPHDPHLPRGHGGDLPRTGCCRVGAGASRRRTNQ